MQRLFRIFAIPCVVAFLAGCGGAGSSSTPQSLPQGQQSDSRQPTPSGVLPQEHAASGVTPRSVPTAPPRSRMRPMAASTASNDSTVDECLGTGWCVIQGQTMEYGPITWPVDAGSTVTYSVSSQTNGISVSVNPTSSSSPPYATTVQAVAASSVSVGYATFTLDGTVSNPDCTNHYCGPDNLGPVTIYVQCSVDNKHCPALKITDANLSRVVSGTPPLTANTVVGEQANLTAAWDPDTGTPSYGVPTNIQWSIPGTTIKTYNRDGTQPVLLGSSDLQTPNVAFYWIAGGTEPPTVSGTLTRSDNAEIADVQMNANYNVQVPTSSITLTTPTTPGIYVGTRSDVPGQFLTWGDQNNPAINFAYNVSNNDGFAGTIAMTQLIDRTYTKNDTTVQATSGQLWLDNDANYASISEPTGTTLNAIDAPGIGLSNSYTTETNSDSFTDYFMYMPNSHGVWVTLKTASWSWNAGATIVNVNNNLWCLDSVGTCPNTTPLDVHSTNPPATVSTILPTWPGTFQNSTGAIRALASNGNRTTWHITPLSYP